MMRPPRVGQNSVIIVTSVIDGPKVADFRHRYGDATSNKVTLSDAEPALVTLLRGRGRSTLPIDAAAVLPGR